MSRRLLVPGLVLGALIRLATLTWPGTGDVLVFKVWSFAAANDLTGIYGVGGSPPERRVVHWQGVEMTVDYPPIALVELGLAGRLYRAFHPLYDNSPALNAAIRLPGLAWEIALVVVLLTWGRRALGADAAARAVLWFWLNPAVLLDGPLLGYFDPAMAGPAVLSVIAIFACRPWVAGVLLAVAGLTKAQPIFIAPAVLAAVAWQARSRLRALAEATLGAGAVIALAVGPIVLRGAWSNLTQALGRLATHDMLSAHAPNIWWIFTYVLRVRDVAGDWGWWRSITQEVRILGIARTMELGYPNPRLIGLALIAAVIVWAVWKMRAARSLADVLALTGLCGWAFPLLGAQVHENHLYLAVPFLAIAAGLDRRYARPALLVSAIFALNLYLFEGLGHGQPSGFNRSWTLIDTSVLLAVANVAAFVYTLVKGSEVFSTDLAGTVPEVVTISDRPE